MNETHATIKVICYEDLTIDEITSPLENKGWDILSAWIVEKEEN